MTARFDVVVVGCGPAGNLAAHGLAERGLRVAQLERERLPRVKVCGGGLTPKALAALPYDVSPVVHRRIVGGRVRVAGGVRIEVERADAGAMVERAEFDAFMAERGRRAGVELVVGARVESVEDDGLRVRVGTSAGEFEGALLVAADGARSTVRALRFPDWRPRWAFAIEGCWHWDGDGPDDATLLSRPVFDFDAIGRGYGWIFPKRDHFNVGIYRLARPRGEAGLRAALDAFARDAVLAGCAPRGLRGHPIPVADGRQPRSVGRTILVGDAAGLAEGVLGEGIAFALASGRMAADWVAASLVGGAFRPRRSWDEAIAPLVDELRWSWRLARLLYAVPPPLLRRVVASARAREAMLAMLHGELGYRAAFWKLLRAAPRVVLR